MAKRNLLNVRSLLELVIQIDEQLLPLCVRMKGNKIPPLLIDAIQEAGFYARAILRKHSHTRKDVRVNN